MTYEEVKQLAISKGAEVDEYDHTNLADKQDGTEGQKGSDGRYYWFTPQFNFYFNVPDVLAWVFIGHRECEHQCWWKITNPGSRSRARRTMEREGFDLLAKEINKVKRSAA